MSRKVTILTSILYNSRSINKVIIKIMTVFGLVIAMCTRNADKFYLEVKIIPYNIKI